MKKKHVLFISCLAIVLSSCLFENDDDGLSSWLSDQGLPDNYNVQTLSIDGIMPENARAYKDTTPTLMASSIVFGKSAELSHEMAIEFGYRPNAENLAKLKSADTAEAYVSFPLVKEFYTDKNIKSKVFPLKEKLKVSVSWKLTKGDGKKYIDSIADIPDSVWLENLKQWTPDVVFDTTYSINAKAKGDSILYFDMPKAFIDSIANCENACHLEMRFAAPESENLYRFYVSNGKKSPILRIAYMEKGDTLKNLYPIKPFPISPYRMADVVVDNDCSDCLTLHGGGYDSLSVEFPSKPILNALSEFYGDDFPYTVGDGYDVRQAVVLAQLTFARDDADNESQFGLPIQVVTGSFLDSAGSEYLLRELYSVNKKLVKESGHPNMVFYKGDSLSLQVTEGVREFINRANEGSKLKVMMRLGLPVLQDKDPAYRDTVYTKRIVCDTINAKAVCDTITETSQNRTKLSNEKHDYTKTVRDTSYRFLNHYDYARYDFAGMMNKPVTLKLWLATKRGDEK